MSDITELIEEGVLCEICGEYIGLPTGFPQSCRGCGKENNEQDNQDR